VEVKNRQERMKMVRDQEKQASRLLLQETLEKKQIEQERMQEQARYQEYLTKKQEIERLKMLRELEIERQGKAMRDAEDAEERRLRE
jgi:outer membrane biogenesis lipoprotein LolB